jgi:phenylpropionate dioxygenase-like ring-hydroxylating dioxygenase large terminal subunit
MDGATLMDTTSGRPGYPVNCWWVAATIEEVTRMPLARRLLDRPVVLFRTESGSVIALEDRCAHRRAPLSLGKLLGDEITCPYHGFRYDGAGRCTHIPTQTHIPPALAVKRYPVCEHGPFVWIWMGEVSQADPARLPALSWPANPTGVRFGTYGVRQCSYNAVQENYMDLAHILFLHSWDQDWLRYGDSPQHLQSCTTLEETSDTLVRTTNMIGVDPVPLDAKTLGLEAGQKVNTLHRCTFLPPGCFFQEEDNDWATARTGTRKSYGYRAIHCTTPVSSGSCHWWRSYAYDFGYEATQEYQARWNAILKEDYDLLEAIQAAATQGATDATAPDDILVHADRSVAIVRKMLGKMLEAEAPS